MVFPVSVFENRLIRLTNEQHERFNQLRERFSDEMEEREHVQDMEDAQLREDEEAYLEMREQEDWRHGQTFLQVRVLFCIFVLCHPIICLHSKHTKIEMYTRCWCLLSKMF